MNSQGQSPPDRITLIVRWIKHNRRTLVGALAVIVIAAAGLWFAIATQRRREAFAERDLASARAAAQAGNLPLAASDLSRLIQSHAGTHASDEATILLAQVRLQQGDAQTVTTELRARIAEGLEDEYVAAAHGLLAGALEQLGSMGEAGEAYVDAADASWYDLLSAQYLNDAGRAFAAAGDTARAAAAYERLLADFSGSPAATEARVRLAELRPAEPSVGT